MSEGFNVSWAILPYLNEEDISLSSFSSNSQLKRSKHDKDPFICAEKQILNYGLDEIKNLFGVDFNDLLYDEKKYLFLCLSKIFVLNIRNIKVFI